MADNIVEVKSLSDKHLLDLKVQLSILGQTGSCEILQILYGPTIYHYLDNNNANEVERAVEALKTNLAGKPVSLQDIISLADDNPALQRALRKIIHEHNTSSERYRLERRKQHRKDEINRLMPEIVQHIRSQRNENKPYDVILIGHDSDKPLLYEIKRLLPGLRVYVCRVIHKAPVICWPRGPRTSLDRKRLDEGHCNDVKGYIKQSINDGTPFLFYYSAQIAPSVGCHRTRLQSNTENKYLLSQLEQNEKNHKCRLLILKEDSVDLSKWMRSMTEADGDDKPCTLWSMDPMNNQRS